jgi:hypothetical protein
MAETYSFSLKPSDAVQGGTMVQEGEYTIKYAKFTLNDYNGTVIPGQPALLVEFMDAHEISHYQYYSAGDIKNIEPTGDGRTLKMTNKANGRLNTGTNCYAFLKSLVDAGFPEERFGGDIGVIAGLSVKVVHEEAPERSIGGKTVAKKMIPVVGAILSYPDTKDKAKPSVKSSAATKKANGAEEPASGDLKAKAAEVLIKVLKDGGGMLHMKQITKGIYDTLPFSDADRSPILNLVVAPPFLQALADRGVIYDPDKGTMMYVGD